MSQQWKMICKVKDLALGGHRVVQRGLAWQELPGVVVYRSGEDDFHALLDRFPQSGGPLSQGVLEGQWIVCPRQGWRIALASGCAGAAGQDCTRAYSVKVEDGKVYLDMLELNAPASRAEAALAGAFSVTPHIVPH